MRTLTTLAIAGASAAAAGPLLAQANCAARDVLVERLESGYGEHFRGGGMQDSLHIFEVWASEKDGTWTILMTRADGTSCVMASGTAWRKGLPEAQLSGVPG